MGFMAFARSWRRSGGAVIAAVAATTIAGPLAEDSLAQKLLHGAAAVPLDERIAGRFNGSGSGRTTDGGPVGWPATGGNDGP